MEPNIPHVRIPLNLPHAGTIAGRIERQLLPEPASEGLMALVQELLALLGPFSASGENPGDPEAREVVAKAQALGRRIVDAIEQEHLGHDRIGQAIRNLFECLELGREGAVLSLRAGENPNSALRPV